MASGTSVTICGDPGKGADAVRLRRGDETPTAVRAPGATRDLPGLLRACGPAEPEPQAGVLDATATGSPQLGPLSTGLPHAEVPLSTVVAGVGGSAQGSPQPAESVGKGVVGHAGWRQGAPRTEGEAPGTRVAAATNPARLGAPLPRDQALGRPDPHVALCTRGTGLASQATEPSAAALAAA